jgi:hypothetical protein
MKGLTLAIVAALVAGLLPLAGTAQAQATRIPFTESESCVVTSPGEWTYPDGNIHIRGLTQECDHPASIPELVGTDYMVINANLDATGSGPVWITWRLETEGGGWEGVWHGTITGLLTSPYGTGRGVGHGTGIYEGQQYFAEAVITPAGTAATGYVLVP